MAGSLMEEPQAADKFRAQSFVDKWKGKLEGIAEGAGEKQHDQEFWDDLVEAFGQSRDILEFQSPTSDKQYSDVVCRKLGFIVEQKSKGIPLDEPEIRHGESLTPFQPSLEYRNGFTSN